MDALPIVASLIPQVYYWGVFIFCLFLYFRYAGSSNCDKLLRKNSMVPALLMTFFLMIFIGLRPVSGVFGDTVNYAYGYRLATDSTAFSFNFESEWFWGFIMNLCKSLGFSVNAWFLLIEIGYLGFTFLGLRVLLWENSWMAMLFFLSAFSTFTFGTNGLRNGLACSMVIFAIAILANNSFKHVLGAGVILILAFGIHRSIALPVLAFVAASFVIKSPMMAIYFWIASIGISLVAGGTVTAFFMGLGFDDRMTQYVVTADEYKDDFSGGLGFRWDFLLYSSMPVLLTWYVCKKVKAERQAKGITTEELETGVKGAGLIADANSLRVYNILATTYILSNSFWVMVIRAAFSNRFAYLSWFLYPVVMAYAVIRLHLWKNQDQKAGLILLLHAGFTIFMYIMGKAR